MLFRSIFRNDNVTSLCTRYTPTMLYAPSPEKWSFHLRGRGEWIRPPLSEFSGSAPAGYIFTPTASIENGKTETKTNTRTPGALFKKWTAVLLQVSALPISTRRTITINNWFRFYRARSSYGARGKFREHERSVRVTLASWVLSKRPKCSI